MAGSEQKLDMFKLLAELSTNCGPLEPAATRIQTIYETLIVSPKFGPRATDEFNIIFLSI